MIEISEEVRQNLNGLFMKHFKRACKTEKFK